MNSQPAIVVKFPGRQDLPRAAPRGRARDPEPSPEHVALLRQLAVALERFPSVYSVLSVFTDELFRQDDTAKGGA